MELQQISYYFDPWDMGQETLITVQNKVKLWCEQLLLHFLCIITNICIVVIVVVHSLCIMEHFQQLGKNNYCYSTCGVSRLEYVSCVERKQSEEHSCLERTQVFWKEDRLCFLLL